MAAIACQFRHGIRHGCWSIACSRHGTVSPLGGVPRHAAGIWVPCSAFFALPTITTQPQRWSTGTGHSFINQAFIHQSCIMYNLRLPLVRRSFSDKTQIYRSTCVPLGSGLVQPVSCKVLCVSLQRVRVVENGRRTAVSQPFLPEGSPNNKSRPVGKHARLA